MTDDRAPERLSRNEWGDVAQRAGESGRSARWLARRLPGEREMPAYVIAGVKRGGTSSLHEYLMEHPLVLRPNALKGTHYFDVNHGKGARWFVGHFPLRRHVDRLALPQRPIVGDASPYLSFYPGAPQRLAAELPDTKVIVVLRDPASRAWSHFKDETERGFETRRFQDALEQEADTIADLDPGWPATYEGRHHSYLSRGRYAEQVATLFDLFGRTRTRAILSSELFSMPQEVMGRLYSFLGLPDHVGSFNRILKASEPEPMPQESQIFLDEYFVEPNCRLAELLGRNLLWNSS